MFEFIFNTLFQKTKKVKCLTVIKNRTIDSDAFVLCDKENKQVLKTCLSEYFKDRKGLNVSEREKFYGTIFNARNQR